MDYSKRAHDCILVEFGAVKVNAREWSPAIWVNEADEPVEIGLTNFGDRDRAVTAARRMARKGYETPIRHRVALLVEREP